MIKQIVSALHKQDKRKLQELSTEARKLSPGFEEFDEERFKKRDLDKK